MDGLAMALHISYQTNSFKEAILMAVNQGGDCDTVGAIVGQITGAMYGVDKKMSEWYKESVDGKKHEILAKAYKLFHKRGLD